ncbi:leucine-rich repeat domain-containing protein [bacterium SCSIO 12741]|nr:leucine-rich repeat domain-containing protein [bacterium SCSIO 12741]
MNSPFPYPSSFFRLYPLSEKFNKNTPPILVLVFVLVLTQVLLLPSSLPAQRRLKYADLVDKIVVTDLEMAKKYPNKVKKLDLSGQHFAKIPDEVFFFRNLEVLRMDSVGLQEVNWIKGKLRKLVRLELNGNELTEFKIPKRQLSHLQELYLDDNQLTTFPQFDNPYMTLKVLSLRKNNISQIPLNYTELKNLRFLNLDSNPLDRAEDAFSLSLGFNE